MYYMRKLSNNPNLSKIKEATDIDLLDADILKQEFGTTGNTLSFWKCDDLEHPEDTMKAILLSGTYIKTAQFFIVDDELIEKYQLTLDDTEPGKTAYAGFEGLHTNMTLLTYGRIGTVLRMLNESFKDEKLTPKLNKPKVKQYIKEVKDAGMLDESKLQESLKEDIEKLYVTT